MKKTKWDAIQYNKFHSLRQKPNIDLLSALPKQEFNNILDLGSGNGDLSSSLLLELNPTSKIIAIDSDKESIQQGKKNFKNIKWIHSQAEKYKFTESFDLITCCSMFQWIEQHNKYIPHFFKQLNINGYLCIQMPNMFSSKFYTLISVTLKELHLEKKVGYLRKNPVHTEDEYKKIISNLTSDYKIWEKTYNQKLVGKDSLIEWSKGAPLRPVISRLTSNELSDFINIYHQKLTEYYPYNGEHYILPFSRLFLILKRTN